MKVTDYIISQIESHGIRDIFGYPGGVICHFIDSAYKNNNIRIHTLYHEQAVAFAACSFAQASHNVGIAYATSGPGATNLITGIADAWFDSIPVIFFTGNVDTYQQKNSNRMRQRGFQETDISAIIHPITKYSVSIQDKNDVEKIINKAFEIAKTGRPGPVLVDLPADIQRADITVSNTNADLYSKENSNDLHFVIDYINKSKRPLLLVGAGVKQANCEDFLKKIVHQLNIPVVESLPAMDFLPFDDVLNMGFIGANGKRYSNILLDKCDLLITIGSRLELKQVGNDRGKFASNAQIIRIDCEADELQYKVHDDELQLNINIIKFLDFLNNNICNIIRINQEWINTGKKIKEDLSFCDLKGHHELIQLVQKKFSDTNITVDVGQHMLWVAQAVALKEGQHMFMSAGLGSMGYSLPAAIGVYFATKKPVIAFCGDGGFQMNIQELEFISKEKLPILIVIINNYALGMIRQFQEKNFSKVYVQTSVDSGYGVPDFSKIASAYGLRYYQLQKENDVNDIQIDIPALAEIKIYEDTYLEPNFGKKEEKFSNMVPEIDQIKYKKIMEL
jgi:acetolactate synthase I/II/III large subunit